MSGALPKQAGSTSVGTTEPLHSPGAGEGMGDSLISFLALLS